MPSRLELQTGLTGGYDFELDVGMRRGPNEGRPGADGAGSTVVPDSGPTIFNALTQIGLKLEGRKMPLQVIVIEKAERP